MTKDPSAIWVPYSLLKAVRATKLPFRNISKDSMTYGPLATTLGLYNAETYNCKTENESPETGHGMHLHSLPNTHLILAGLCLIRGSQELLVIECLMLNDTLSVELSVHLLFVNTGRHVC